jgi:DNA repair exonuclease SbcCD nuclease subunit
MKRTSPTKRANVQAILTSDLHLREDTPVCRTDEVLTTLERKLSWLKELQQKCGGVPVLDAGDTFNLHKPSPALISFAINNLPKPFFTIPGNHDLPQHSLDLFHRSGLNTLGLNDCIEAWKDLVGWGIPWGGDLSTTETFWRTFRKACSFNSKPILLYHGLVYPSGRMPWPGSEREGLTDAALHRECESFRLIVTGHYHRSFCHRTEDGRALVNPGGILRMTADEKNRQPQVWLWYEDGSVEAVDVPIEQGVMRDDHVIQEQEKNERMEAFLSRLGGEGIELGLSFRQNLERFMEQNGIRQAVREEVWRNIDG